MSKQQPPSKDHTPSGFDRRSGYISDLEHAELHGSYVNTNGKNCHNVYIYEEGKHGPHEHFFYDPQNQKSGWHGSQYETANNKPSAHRSAFDGNKTSDTGGKSPGNTSGKGGGHGNH